MPQRDPDEIDQLVAGKSLRLRLMRYDARSIARTLTS